MTRALDLVSLGYVMDRLGLSKAHVLSLVKAGAIPSHQIRPGPAGRMVYVFEAHEIDRVRGQRYRERFEESLGLRTIVRQQRSRRAG